MKVLFKAIRQGNLDEVKRILNKKPELISCTATAPPKKDEGQSPLQVAIKSDNVEVAEYLLTLGADVNFMEDHVYYEGDMRAPIWYDAVEQIYLKACYDAKHERRERYIALFCQLLSMGADPNKESSSGWTAWNRVLFDYQELFREEEYSLYVTEKLMAELVAHGADIFCMPPGSPEVQMIIFNLSCNRDMMDGQVYKLENVAEAHRRIWNLLEPMIRPYYMKDNPFYDMKSSEDERREFLEKQEQAIEDAQARRKRDLDAYFDFLKRQREMKSKK